MTYYVLLFVAGFAGSFHCIGMCGGFACALGRDPRGAGATVAAASALQHRQVDDLLFPRRARRRARPGDLHARKAATAVPLLSASLDVGQRALAVVAGLLMIVMALQFFGLLRLASRRERLRRLHARGRRCAACSTARPRGAAGFRCVQRLSAVSAGLRHRSPRPRAPLTCCPAVLTMASFGLGTFPAMLADGRRRPVACAQLAAARCAAGRQLHSGCWAWSRSAAASCRMAAPWRMHCLGHFA